MPAFGDGRNIAFGEWDWSRQVLWDFLPVKMRATDASIKDANGELYHPMENFVTGISPAIELARGKIAKFDDLRDPQRVRTQYNETSVLRLGRIIPNQGQIQQRGVDGRVQVGTLYFEARTARFKQEDVGKELTIVNSTIPVNKQPVNIIQVINATTVATNPLLSSEAGPLRWELRGQRVETDYTTVEVQTGNVGTIAPSFVIDDGVSKFEVTARDRFRTSHRSARLFTSRQAFDGTVNESGIFVLKTAVLNQGDVGKNISISKSVFPENNNSFEIRKIVGTNVYTSYQVVPGATHYGAVAYNAKFIRDAEVRPRIRHAILGNAIPSISITVDEADITVFLATDVYANPISTAAEVVAAVNADTAASALVVSSIETLGTGRAGLSDFETVEGYLLTFDSSLLFWALLPRPELRLAGRILPNGAILKDGSDLTVVSTSGSSATLKISRGLFENSDSFSTILIRGSSLGNDGVHRVLQIVDATTVVVDAPLVLEGPLYWEMRHLTALGDRAQVVARPQSLIALLAQDYGLSTDLNETEARQRASIFHHNQWIGIKGHPDSYSSVARLSGFDAIAVHLWRIDPTFSNFIPPDAVQLVADPCEGRFGFDGELRVGGDGIQFYDKKAKFDNCDDLNSLQIIIFNSTNPANNKIYTIFEVVDDNTVNFRSTDNTGVILPDYGAGSLGAGTLAWRIVRVYSTVEPLLLRYDEFSPDALKTYIDAQWGTIPDLFTADRFCTETNFTTRMVVNISQVTQISPSEFNIRVDIKNPGPGSLYADIVEIIPNPLVSGARPPVVKLTDSANLLLPGPSQTVSYLESFPKYVGTSPFTQAEFLTKTAIAPALGIAELEFVCMPVLFDCDFCPTSVILLRLISDSIANDPPEAQIGVVRRTLLKMDQLPRPSHVRLVPQIEPQLLASMRMSAQSIMNPTQFGVICLTTDSSMTADAPTAQAGVNWVTTSTMTANAVSTLVSSCVMVGTSFMIVGQPQPC